MTPPPTFSPSSLWGNVSVRGKLLYKTPPLLALTFLPTSSFTKFSAEGMTQMPKSSMEGLILMMKYDYALGHRSTTVTGPWELQQRLWICVIHLLQRQASCRDWLQLTAAALYGCEHKCLEGSLIGISCPFSKTVAVTSPTGLVTSPDTGLLLAYNRELPPVQSAFKRICKAVNYTRGSLPQW